MDLKGERSLPTVERERVQGQLTDTRTTRAIGTPWSVLSWVSPANLSGGGPRASRTSGRGMVGECSALRGCDSLGAPLRRILRVKGAPKA